MKRIEILGLQTIPQINPGDNLPQIIVDCANAEMGGLRDRDILVITSKIVSKAAGRIRNLSDVVPSERAFAISKRTGKDAKWLQMIFDEGHEILAIVPIKGIVERHIMNASGADDICTKELCEHEQALCITMAKDGRIHTCDAGIDGSNHPPGVVSLLPEDPDLEAKQIREQILKLTGKEVAVILADTEMIPFGTMDFALGSSGIKPRAKMFGQKDLFGRPKFGGIDLIAHELTAASALLFGQTHAGIPAVLIRGCTCETSETENISDIMSLPSGRDDVAAAIKATLRATAWAASLKHRLLLRAACWFF